MRQIILTLLFVSFSIMPAQANAEAVGTESPAYQAAMTESEHWRVTTKALTNTSASIHHRPLLFLFHLIAHHIAHILFIKHDIGIALAQHKVF